MVQAFAVCLLAKHDNLRLMTEINPAGTLFLGLIEELMDLLAKPDVSRIEVVMRLVRPSMTKASGR